jgi:hypothetical protein
MVKKKKSTVTIQTQLVIATASVILLVMLGLFVAVADRVWHPKTAGTDATSATYDDVTIKGVAACLPHKGDDPQTQECILGVKTASGVYYGVDSISYKPTVDDVVEVNGKLQPASNDTYDIAGLVVVK